MLLNRVYYQFKPVIPWRLRNYVRGAVVRRKRNRVSDVWPIKPGSEVPPANWPGWPGGKKFAFVLTHDVESLAGLGRCRALMELELQMGFRSSFNFVPEGEYRVAEAQRVELEQNGFEIGIHDLHHDGKLYRSQREFAMKADRINHYVREWKVAGFRSGFMHHNLEWLHDLEVEYDASTFDTDPFEPQPDGVDSIFPFWVSQNGSDGYMELPYTLAQDSTMFLLLREKTTKLWNTKLDWIADHGGMALLIIHPDYISINASENEPFTYPLSRYRSFLAGVREKYEGCYWHALPREVASYCRSVRAANAPIRFPIQPDGLHAGSHSSNTTPGRTWFC